MYGKIESIRLVVDTYDKTLYDMNHVLHALQLYLMVRSHSKDDTEFRLEAWLFQIKKLEWPNLEARGTTELAISLSTGM